MADEIGTKKQKSKFRGKIIIIIILLAVIGIAAFVYIKGKKSKELSFVTEKLERGRITSIVSSTGSLEAVTTVDVGSQVSGTIDAVFADYNDHVKKGQLLAKIDPSLYETQLEKSQASLQSSIAQFQAAKSDFDKAKIGIATAEAGIFQAQAQVEKSKSDLENAKSQLSAAVANQQKAKAQLENDKSEYYRSDDLFKRQLVSKSDRDKAYTTYQVSKSTYDSTKDSVNSAKATVRSSESTIQSSLSNLKAAEIAKQSAEVSAKSAQSNIMSASASVKQAESDVASVKVNIERCIIRAPIDGIIIARKIEMGQTVAASYQTPVLFQLAQNLKFMEVKASVDEADIGKVKDGQSVTFTVDAFPEDTFQGKISQVRSSPTTSENVVTYEVIIRTDNKELKLKPGMTANIDITSATKENVLKIPNSALRFKPDRYPNFPYPEGMKKESAGKKSGFGGGHPGGPGGPPRRQSSSPSPTPVVEKGKGKLSLADVWVLENGKPKKYNVRTGITDNMYTEMKSGDLKEGMELITDAAVGKEKKGEAKSGARVRVRM